jgi:hypothetical protein
LDAIECEGLQEFVAAIDKLSLTKIDRKIRPFQLAIWQRSFKPSKLLPLTYPPRNHSINHLFCGHRQETIKLAERCLNSYRFKHMNAVIYDETFLRQAKTLLRLHSSITMGEVFIEILQTTVQK